MKNNNLIIRQIDKFYKMKKEDVEKFADCAALAYEDYPLFNYTTGGRGGYKLIKGIIYSSVNSIRNQIIAYSNNENADAVAIFAPPNYTGSKTIPFLLHGGLKLTFIAPPSTFIRLIKYENHAMKLKKKYTNHECWYLYNITIKPKDQGKGYCSEILNPMFEYLDENNQDCYLETHTEENVNLYKHYNFELLEISNIPKTNVKHYSMIRRSNPKSNIK